MSGLFAPLVALASSEIRLRVDRARAVALGYGLAAVGALGIGVIGLISLHRYLGGLWGAYMADLALAGLFLIPVLAGLWMARPVAPAAAPARADAATAAAATAAVSAAPALLGLLRGGSRAGLVGAGLAVLAGVLAGRAAQRR